MSFVFLSIIRMIEKTLKFDNVRFNKKEFHKSKQQNADEIVASDKLKHSDDGFKCLIGYKGDEIVKSLYIILPQMSEYTKYFENIGKNLSFMIKTCLSCHCVG